MLIQAGTVNNEGTSDDNLIFTGNSALSEQQNESSTPGNDSDADGKLNCKDDLKNTVDDFRPSESLDTFIKVDHSNGVINDVDIFDNVFAYETQSHEQPEYINDTCVVNQVDSDITPETPHMDPNGGMVEHDNVNHNQECASNVDLEAKLKIFEKTPYDISLIVESQNLKVENEMSRHENEKILKESSDIQEKLKRQIFSLEQNFQRCQAQSFNFELALQHNLEKHSFENP